MTLLCIGRSGQVATALRERSNVRGVRLFNAGRPDTDLLDIASCKTAIERHQPEIVINAAAYTHVDKAESDLDAAMALNGEAPGNLARLCREMGLPLIHISTDYVFDGSLDRPYLETDPTGPVSAYGISKLAGEQAVRAELTEHIIMRTSWVYSPFGSNFVATMLRLAKERGGAGVVDDQLGTPTSALDIADAILEIADHLADGMYGTYQFTNAGSCTWADFASLVFSIYDERNGSQTELKRITTADFPTPAERPKNSRLSTNKLSEAFGIEPRNWQEAVAETVERLL